MEKTYKDLSPEEETQLNLWLEFFHSSLKNTHLQMKRCEQAKNNLKTGMGEHLFWDIQMFIVALILVFDATEKLKPFLSYDSDVWGILKKFRSEVEKCKIKALRNDVIHPEKVFQWQDRKGDPLPASVLVMFGVYHGDRDEYTYGPHSINVSETFDLVNRLTQDMKTLATNRLSKFHETPGHLEGMIPFMRLGDYLYQPSGHNDDSSIAILENHEP